MSASIPVIIVFAILIFNAFMVGRIIKKINFSFNSYICFFLAIMVIFVALYIIWLPFYLASAPLLGYLIMLLIFQTIMLLIYAYNWRYIVISLKISYTPMFYLLVILILTILISYLNFRNYDTYMANDIFNIINKEQKITSKIIIDSTNSTILNYYSATIVIDKINVCLFNLYNVNNTSTIQEYLNWNWTLVYSLAFSSLVVGGFYKKIINRNFLMQFILIVFAGIITQINLIWYEGFFIPITWLGISVLAIIIFSEFIFDFSSNRQSVWLAAILMLFTFTVDAIFFWICTIYLIFIFFYFAYNRQNVVRDMNNLSIVYIIITFLYIATYNNVGLILFACSLFFVVGIILARRSGLKFKWTNQVNNFFYNNLSTIAWLVFFIFVVTMMIVMSVYYDLDFKFFNNHDYYLLGFKIKAGSILNLVFRIISWVVIGLIFVYSLIITSYRFKRKQNLEPELMLNIITVVILMNPLSINVLQEIINPYEFNSNNMSLILWAVNLCYLNQFILNKIETRGGKLKWN